MHIACALLHTLTHTYIHTKKGNIICKCLCSQEMNAEIEMNKKKDNNSWRRRRRRWEVASAITELNIRPKIKVCISMESTFFTVYRIHSRFSHAFLFSFFCNSRLLNVCWALWIENVKHMDIQSLRSEKKDSLSHYLLSEEKKKCVRSQFFFLPFSVYCSVCFFCSSCALWQRNVHIVCLKHILPYRMKRPKCKICEYLHNWMIWYSIRQFECLSSLWCYNMGCVCNVVQALDRFVCTPLAPFAFLTWKKKQRTEYVHLCVQTEKISGSFVRKSIKMKKAKEKKRKRKRLENFEIEVRKRTWFLALNFSQIKTHTLLFLRPHSPALPLSCNRQNTLHKHWKKCTACSSYFICFL